MLEAFLTEDSITQLLKICWLHIYDMNLLFHRITKVLCWLEIWWTLIPSEDSDLWSMHGALSCRVHPSEDGYTVVIKGSTWSATMLRYTITLSPAAWTIQPDTKPDGSMLLCLILSLPSKCHSWHYNSLKLGNFFQSSIVQFWWAHANCSHRSLFLAYKSDTRCGLLLL